MSDERRSLLPENLEKVAEAGGWDERQAEKAKEFMQEAAKIKKNQWVSMNENLSIVRDFASGSNLSLLEDLPDSIMETITLKTDELFAPFKNEINTLITNALQPFIDQLNPVVNNLAAFIGDNAIGGTVGALSGLVVGKFVGSPLLGSFIGGIIGAALQEWTSQIAAAAQGPVDPFQHPLTPGSHVTSDFEKWGNAVNQWWYDYWIAMGWR